MSAIHVFPLPQRRNGVQLAILLLAGIMASLVTVWLLGHMGTFGRNIPQEHIVSDYVRGWIWAMGLSVLLVLIPMPDRWAMLHVWLVKVAVDLGIMLIYEWHYGLDAYVYFARGVWGQHASFWPVIGDGTTTIMRFSGLLSYLTGPSYHAMKILYSFIGLWGCFCFYRAACHFLRDRKTWLLYVVAFTPSVLFWSSILGKDPVIFFGAGLYALGVVGWLRTGRIRYSLILAAGILIAMFVRDWYGVIMVAPILFALAPRLRHPLQRVLAVAGGVGSMMFAYRIFQQEFLEKGLASVLPTINDIMGGYGGGGSSQVFQGFHSLASMLEFWPWGAFTAAFRPMPWDVHNFFMVLPALEGTAIVLLVIFAARHWTFARLHDPVIAWALTYVACWASLYGFAGFGNLGMAVRERLEVMPILVLLALLLGTRRGRRMTNELQSSIEHEPWE